MAMLRATLVQCDLFYPSVDEIEALTGLAAADDIVRWSLDQGARAVALKLGAKGSPVSSGSGVEDVLPHRVQPVDATGAGDCYAGTMLARLAVGAALAQAARAANIAAALSTQGHGAVRRCRAGRTYAHACGSAPARRMAIQCAFSRFTLRP